MMAGSNSRCAHQERSQRKGYRPVRCRGGSPSFPHNEANCSETIDRAAFDSTSGLDAVNIVGATALAGNLLDVVEVRIARMLS
jgi:hypothetical protein